MRAVLFFLILIIFIFSFFSFLIFLNNSILAQEGEEPPPCPPAPSPPICSDSWTETEYQCVGGCGGTLQIRSRSCWWDDGSPVEVTDEQGCVTGYNGCSGPYTSGCSDWGPWSNVETCHPAKMCRTSPPSCACRGGCYPAPPASALFDLDKVETDLKNVFDPQGKVKLPLISDWKDWQNWEGWDINGCSVNSYQYQFQGGGEIITKCTTLSEAVLKDCTLKSNTDYSWQVRACLDSGCGDCGSWSSSQSFSTSLSPEPLKPYDPDWQGPNGAENVSIPTEFKWCDTTPYTNTKTYYVRLYKEGVFYYPFPIEEEGGALRPETVFDVDVLTKYTGYEWEVANCATKDNTKCGINCTEKQEGSDCGDYSQKWKFTTGEITLPAPNIISPKTQNGIPVVNYSDNLSWEPLGLYGVAAYYYEIKRGQDIITASPVPIEITSVSFADFWQKLYYDETYTAEVKSCWNEAGTKCDRGTEITFKTTGAAPNLIFPDQNAQSVVIPVNLNWDDVPGALSYKYQIVSDPTFVNILKIGTTTKSEGLVDYPTLKQNIEYYWRVSSCADKDGRFCADLENIWSTVRNFTTFTLTVPSNPVPANGDEFPTSERYFKWDKVLGAKFYQYKADLAGTERIPPTIVPASAAPQTVENAFLSVEKMLELGVYTWQVKACLDENCMESGAFSGPWQFTLVQGECQRSLVPCGRNCDVFGTPWNEREPCQLRHFFLLFKNILDFILWTLIPIILVLLALASGLIYYFSMGDVSAMARVKSIWKLTGIGCLIIFSAWFIINWLLLFLGFQVQIFGRWWQSPF